MIKSLFRKMAFLCLPFTLFSHALYSESAVDECSKELILVTFPEQFVTEILKKENLTDEQIAQINQELTEKSKNVVSIVEEKASKIDPNPLKDPQQRQVAVKIFRDTLYDLFAGVLKDHGITDDQKILTVFDGIQRQKALRFAKCMQKSRNEAPAEVK